MTDPRPLAVNRYRDVRAGDLTDSNVGVTVRLAGWIAAKRDHGGLLFIDLRDDGGVVQLVSHPDNDVFELLTHLRVESVITVSGRLVARPEDTVNPKLATGTVEVVVEQA